MSPKATVNASMLRRAALVALPLALVLAGAMYLLYRAELSASRSVVAASERDMVEIARQRVAGALATVISDIRYLSEQPALRRWLATNDPAARRNLAAEYLAFSTHKAIYDQVRFLDLEGREVVRVDWNAGAPGVIPDDHLQNKADRYYVRETLKLDPRQLYVSPLDLNVERGLIEQPIKPTIRFGVPVFDEDGRKRGIVLLNYLGQRLLQQIRALAAAYREQIWMLDSQGFWLLGPSAEDEWAFMYPGRDDRTFARTYPEPWKRIEGGPPSGQFAANGDLFAYATVDMAALSSATAMNEAAAANIALPQWILVARLPASTLAADAAPLERYFILTAATLLSLLAVASWLFVRHWAGREAAQRAIRRSEAQFRGLLESAPDAVVVTDRNGRIVFSNAQALRLFGYRPSQLAGKPVDMLVPARYRARHVDHRAKYVASPHARPMGSGLALYGERSDGTEFPVAVSLSPVETDEGMLIFSDIRDVTEQKEVERKLQELNERLARDNADLQALNKELESFSYSVSHDLRAPLRAIDGFGQALLEDCAERLDDAGRGYLDRIRQAAQRMGLLIDDLLKLSRVTRTEMNLDEVDLSAVAETVARNLQQSAPQRAVEFVIAPRLCVQGDPRLLRIAMENLLGNAWKFTAERAPARIEFGRIGFNGEPAYFVRDNGAGFDMAYAGKLFGAFQRLHDAARFPGTGIGLATVQRIVLKHGGRIWADAETNKGATFYFTL